jgi:hypothetical protein
MYKVLFKQVIDGTGPVQTIQWYILGHHPEIGKLHWGLQGAETVVETKNVSPWRKFWVNESAVQESNLL